jgi:hypothetical protein
MSDDSFERFLQAVLDRSDLQERLKTEIDSRGIESTQGLADLAVEMGGEHGYDFSRETARQSIDGLIAERHRQPELTDEELATVAGGADPLHIGKDYAAEPSKIREATQILRNSKLRMGR